MLLNLSQLRAEAQVLIKNKSLDTTRLDRWLNLAQDDIATELDPDHLKSLVQLTTVNGTRTYYIAAEYNKILMVLNKTSMYELTQWTHYDEIMVDPGRVQTGTPIRYSMWGISNLDAPLPAASVIKIVSSSASDTSQKVRINGVVSTVSDTELLTLNGTTTVTGTKSFSEVFSVIKDSTTTGRITVTDNAGTTTLATIAPSDLAIERQPIDLHPVPTSALSVEVWVIRKPRRLINSEDIPDFPSSYMEAILIGAKRRAHIDVYEHNIVQAIDAQEWQPALKKLRAQMNNKRLEMAPRILLEPKIDNLQYGRGRLPSNFPAT